MDRRRLLIGMTAVGLVGRFDLSDLLAAQGVQANGQLRDAQEVQAGARSLAGLRGPVKTCVEETASDRGKSTSTTEYSPNGRILTCSHEMNGKLSYSSSSSDYVQTEVRDSQGRLEKMMWGKRGESVGETLYTYDDAGRLLTFTNTGINRIEFNYQPDGSKISVQTFDPKIIEQRQNSLSASPQWIAAQAGSGVPFGGNVTMIYDTHDNPTEMQIRDAGGGVVTRIVRTYDAEGRLAEERLVEQNMPSSSHSWLTTEELAEMSPAQLNAYSKGLYALIKSPIGTTYAYDSQGRITKTRELNLLFEETTTIFYNAQGNKSREGKRSRGTGFFR